MRRRLSRSSSAKRGSARQCWWSQTGSNRRPPACKAGALPTELWPRRARRVLARRKPEARSQKPEVDVRFLASDFWLLIAGVSHLIVVGLGRLELPTSRLSGVRSNHLSYRPDLPCSRSCLKKEKRRRRNPALF